MVHSTNTTGSLFPADASISFEPTRAAGLARLAAFAPAAGGAYARTRNYDHGPADRSNVSGLSPWIARRAVTEVEALEAVLARHAPSTAEKFVQEVFWRAYFKGWLEHHPGAWTHYARERDAALAQYATSPAAARALAGETGVDCFDSWARELIETGYLHNHARMWFASIWIFTLELPWQLGADFFLRHLLDGDPASNTLSWRWVAGLHTIGKTYLARPDNIRKYTNGRFDPAGLATAAAALVEAARPVRAGVRAPETAAPGAGDRVGLLLTDDDLHPESLLADAGPLRFQPAALAGFSSVTGRSPMAVGERAHAFSHDAMRDALTRAEASFDTPGLVLEAPENAAAWAREERLNAVAAPFAAAGPVRVAVTRAAAALDEIGVPFFEIRRRYDDLAWPHAGKGFFALKKRIPDILDAISI